MMITPSPELKEWVSLAKDISIFLAALFALGLGIYGLRQWKYEHRGKEAFSLVKNLVKESHKMNKACTALRMQVHEAERRIFDAKESKLFTRNEKWKLSERGAFDKRFEKLKVADNSYKEALLDARAVLGSHIYEAFLDFSRHVTENIVSVNNYLDHVLSESFVYVGPNQPELTSVQHLFLIDPNKKSYDSLEERTADAREAGEKSLVGYLGRRGIKR